MVSSPTTRVVSAVLIVVLLLGLVLAGQAATDALVPQGVSDAGAALGRAGFAYLTGLRIFAAAVLWNRLEPVFHEYYGAVPLQEQIYMLPTIRMVIALDPQLIEPYYVAPWILARRGDSAEAFDVAGLGVTNNPRSGVLRASYAQILWLYDGDLDEAVRQADLAVETAEWDGPAQQHDAYAIFGAVYRAAGLDHKSDAMLEEIEHLDELIGDEMPAGTHDHDGDGVPDH